MNRLRHLAWPTPEPELADAGREGETVIAKARLVIVTLLLLPSIATSIREPSAPSGWLGMATAIVCIVIAVEILRRARAGRTNRSLQIAATFLDISLVSAFHVLLFLAGEVGMVLQSRVTFALYVVAIIGAALRYDGQLVRIAGLAAALQYLAIVAWAGATDRATAASAQFYGDATIAGQSEECFILLIATVLGAVIVQRARELRLSGIRDSLTGLANRNYFHERLQSELMRLARQRRPAAVAMIDIDRFKQVNDTYGHAAGDVVLRHVAAVLQRSLRSEDLVARLGGEEFAVLLPDTSLEAARNRLETIRIALRSSQIELVRGVNVTVTASTGIAVAPADSVEAARLLAIADARLLAGKRAGRDVVVTGD